MYLSVWLLHYIENYRLSQQVLNKVLFFSPSRNVLFTDKFSILKIMDIPLKYQKRDVHLKDWITT